MPSDERGIYIKVYADELRDLVQRCGLTRAEGFELVILALRINANNRCYPSNSRIAADMGLVSRANVSRLHNQLRRKGALDWTQDADKRTNTFTLPLCFSFGSDVTQNGYSPDSKLSRSDSKLSQGGDSKLSHKQDTEEQDSVFNKIQTEQHSGQGFALALKSPELDPTKQILLIRALLDSDVDDREAYLLVQQFDPQTIKETIKAADSKALTNKGGWIRSVIEQKAGRTTQYPGRADRQNTKNHRGESAEFHKQFTAAVKAARAISRYEADPYFRQFEDIEVSTK